MNETTKNNLLEQGLIKVRGGKTAITDKGKEQIRQFKKENDEMSYLIFLATSSYYARFPDKVGTMTSDHDHPANLNNWIAYLIYEKL